jgi:hypothetical protein
VRWDDVMAEYGCRPTWQRIPLGWLGSRTWSWVVHFGLYPHRDTLCVFFLYPYVIFAALAPLAWCAGAFIAYRSKSAVVGVATLSPCCMSRRAAGISH